MRLSVSGLLSKELATFLRVYIGLSEILNFFFPFEIIHLLI